MGTTRRTGLSGFEHAEAKVDEFSHGGADGGHFFFASSEQSLVERLDVRVVLY
jgi:surfactin synthase thioesterase subunit